MLEPESPGSGSLNDIASKTPQVTVVTTQVSVCPVSGKKTGKFTHRWGKSVESGTSDSTLG